MSDPLDQPPAARPEDKPDRLARPRTIAAAVLGAVAAVFAVVNLDDVEVDWVIGSAQTPLILVIVLSMVLGAGLDRLLVRRARKRRDATRVRKRKEEAP